VEPSKGAPHLCPSLIVGLVVGPQRRLMVSPFAQRSQLKGKHQPLSLAFLEVNSGEEQNDSCFLSIFQSFREKPHYI